MVYHLIHYSDNEYIVHYSSDTVLFSHFTCFQRTLITKGKRIHVECKNAQYEYTVHYQFCENVTLTHGRDKGTIPSCLMGYPSFSSRINADFVFFILSMFSNSPHSI